MNKTNPSFGWITLTVISFLPLFPGLSRAEIVAPYTADANTLHLWHLDETDPGPATPASGITGSFNLTPDAGKSPGFPATLGNVAFTGFGTAGNTAAGQGSGFKGPSIPVSSLTGADGAFTFEAMVNIANITATQQIIAMEGNGVNSTRPFQFRINGGNISFINIAAGGSPPAVAIPTVGPDAFFANEWFHIAVTYTGDPLAADNFKYYWTRVVGTQTTASELLSTAMTADLAGSASIFGAGNDYRTSGSGNTSNLEGSIDEVRISKVARAADDMLFDIPDIVPPALLTTVPADDATGVALDANLVATFDEAIQVGTGSLTLKRTSDNMTIETFDVANSPSTEITIGSGMIILNPTNNLVAGVEYYVLIDSGAITDTFLNPYPGISDTTAWSFTADNIPPTSTSQGPSPNSPDALLTSGLNLSFDEDVTVGTGSITVHLVGDGSVVETIDVTSGAVSISGSEVSISIADFVGSTAYYVLVPAGTFTDLAGNPFAGISGTTTWSFTTAAVVAPIVPYAADANTLHLWHFNEFDPGPAVPASGVTGSFDLVPSNGATLGTTAFTSLGRAGDLSASVNSVLSGDSITSSALTGIDGEFTFEAIVKLSSFGVEQHIMTMSNVGGTQVFQIRIDPTGEIRFVKVNGVNGTDTDQVVPIPTTGPDAFVPNKWFHVAVTYDGNDNTADNCKIYWTRVDPSRSQATEIGSFTLNGDLDTTTSIPFRVGNRASGVALRGLVDEVRISDIVRGPTEMFLGTGVADITPPSLTTTDPADDTDNVTTFINLTANFDEDIQPGTGAITLKRTSDDSTVETFDVSSSPQLTFGVSSVTIDPTNDLEQGVEYYVIFDASAIEDLFFNGNLAITDSTLWSFTTDGTAPMNTAVGPMTAATEVSPLTDLTLSFDEDVMAGSGNITVHLASDNSVVATIDVTDDLSVMFVGGNVTIVLPSQLAELTGYYVNFGSGVFEDLSGNPAAGISDTTTWAFTTAIIPTGVLFSEDFVGTTSDIDLTTPDVTTAGATWFASPNFNEDGSIDQGAGSATLAFEPFNGLIYTLDASLTGVTGNGNWFGFGFAKGQSFLSTNQDRFITGTVVGRAWMLLRGDASATNNQTFLGTTGPDGGTTDTQPWATFNSENPGGDMDLRLVLDTTGGPGTWTATWFAKRPVDGSYTQVGATALLLDEDIDSVGLALSSAGVFGTIESFSLSAAAGGGGLPNIVDISVDLSGNVVLTLDGSVAGLTAQQSDDLTSFNDVASTPGANTLTIDAADVDPNADGADFYRVRD